MRGTYADVRVTESLRVASDTQPSDSSAPALPPEGVLADMRRFYFDTALSSTPVALPSLLAFADPTHITLIFPMRRPRPVGSSLLRSTRIPRTRSSATRLTAATQRSYSLDWRPRERRPDPGLTLDREQISLRRGMPANGMVQPCSCPASIGARHKEHPMSHNLNSAPLSRRAATN